MALFTNDSLKPTRRVLKLEGKNITPHIISLKSLLDQGKRKELYPELFYGLSN